MEFESLKTVPENFCKGCLGITVMVLVGTFCYKICKKCLEPLFSKTEEKWGRLISTFFIFP